MAKKDDSTPTSPERDPTSIGNLIVKEGLCSKEELNRMVIEFSKASIEMLLGKFLVGKGVLSQERLEILLLKQQADRGDGVEHEHVIEAMKIATNSQEKVNNGIDKLNTATEAALSKASLAKASQG